MRKLALILTLILCALFIGSSSGARGGGPPAGYIEPLPENRETFCNTPGGHPTTGIAYLPDTGSQHAARNSSLTATAAPGSNSVFEKFLRCPAGDTLNPNCTNLNLWLHAADHTSYYRDPIFAASTIISNATNGETWTAEFTLPNGHLVPFNRIVYAEDESSKCFYIDGRPEPICGSSSLKVYWYFNSQCSPVGLGRFVAKHNEAVFADVQYVVKPQISPLGELADKINDYAQEDYPDAPLADTCHRPGKTDFFSCRDNVPGQIPWTIAEQGCGLLSYTAILDYHGVVVDPITLNHWLLVNGYYSPDGNITDIQGIITFARIQNVNMSYIGRYTGNLTGVSSQVCKYGPVSLRVRNNKHSVTAVGMDDAQSTLTILESGNGEMVDLSAYYDNKFNYYQVLAGPEQQFTDNLSNMSFTFHSPVEAFIVDPLGRRKGLDPRTGVTYDEIPDAFYGEYSTIGPVIPDGYEPPKVLEMQRPIEGTYTLSVVGTGEGTYDAEFRMYDQNLGRSQKEFVDIATAPGVVHTYQIEFSKATGAQIVTTGGFDGGGQRPRDVNKFLSYAQPGATSNALPAGTTSYPLLVFFNRSIIASTFHAQLNGVDITSLFNPVPGSGQSVMLPLQRGRNVLQLSVDGNLPNRVATDSDRLVFTVP